MTNEQAIDILSSCYSGAAQPGNTFTSGATGQNCWFKMTSYTPLNESQCLIPSAPWLFITGFIDGTENCASDCAQFATWMIRSYPKVRRNLFGTAQMFN